MYQHYQPQFVCVFSEENSAYLLPDIHTSSQESYGMP